MNYTIRQLNETAIVLTFGDVISDDTTHRVTTLHNALLAQPFEGFRGSVPAYVTLTIYYDFTELNSSGLPGNDAVEKITTHLTTIPPIRLLVNDQKEILIPVCYAGKYAPDLEAVARQLNLPPEEIVELHHSTTYKVAMIGFMPGFPYLSGLADKLKTPRKATPAKVAAGSLGIAGNQTGIYPLESPGGWHIIGRTPLVLFDFRDNKPAYFTPGTTIKFSPITVAEYEALSN